MIDVNRVTPWYRGWNMLAVGIFTTAVVLGVLNFSFTFYVAEWVEEFDSSRGFTMLALSAAQICAGVFFPFAGRAMDRFPIRWIASFGTLVFALALVVVSFAQSVWHIIIIYGVLVAFADALAGPLLAQTLAAKWFRDRRGLAIGLAALGTSIGGFIVPPVVAYFIVEHGWRAANYYVAVLMIVATVPLLMLVVRGQPGPDDDVKKGADQPEREKAGEKAWSAREILTSRNFWFIVIAFLPLMEMTTALIVNLALWTRDLGVGAQKTAFLMSLMSLMMIAGKVLFGHLADRMEIRLLFYIAVGFLLVSLVLMIGSPSYPLMLIIVVLVGVAVGGQMPLAGILVGRCFGAVSFGAAMGLFYLCIRPVAFAGPIGGWVRDVFGSYDYFWMAGIAVVILFTPVLYWVRPERR